MAAVRGPWSRQPILMHCSSSESGGMKSVERSVIPVASRRTRWLALAAVSVSLLFIDGIEAAISLYPVKP